MQEWLLAAVDKIKGSTSTYSDLLFHQLSGVVDLLVRPSDSENLDAGVGIGRGVPLQLYSGPRLLADAFNGLTPYGKNKMQSH